MIPRGRHLKHTPLWALNYMRPSVPNRPRFLNGWQNVGKLELRQRIGWWAGCRVGYPTKWWHRSRLVRWIAERWDPWNSYHRFEERWVYVQAAENFEDVVHRVIADKRDLLRRLGEHGD